MLAPLTTARKATVAAVMAFLSPPTTLLLSEQPITWRTMLAAVLLGALGYLATYETPNTEEFLPPGRHAHPSGAP